MADVAVPIDAEAPLFLRGRIDLILAAQPPVAPALPRDAWIVDYKTGDRKSLEPGRGERASTIAKRLRSGDGLQLALYALAFHELGAETVGISLLTPALELDRPQLMLDDLKFQQSVLRGLRQMQESGVFGMRGRLRDEFAFGGDYPLATLSIDADVIEEKWARTHPDLSNGEEDE
jgi:PD-(D/E)XK nuclease superfamily